jgi:histidinol-phosphate phosphatase family protein
MKEIVVIMGFNAGGKSTVVQDFVAREYHRINRDTTGGNLEGQVTLVNQYFNKGGEKVVLDNTYPTVQSRASLIKLAKDNGAKIICNWLTTSFEDAQLNACLRMVEKTGKVMSPMELKKSNNPNLFPPVALFNYRKIFQEPTTKEGFDEVNQISFVRKWPANYTNKAILLDYDGTLRTSLGQEEFPIKISDIKVHKNTTAILHDFESKGYHLLGVSNQSGVARGIFTEQDARKCFDETNRQLNIKVDYCFCPHQSAPVACFCRKPHPAFGAYFITKYKLNPKDCIMVGDLTSDKTFATRCGFRYVEANEFFK